ncbi:MAG: PadR family transcriptional regulator [Candidatus Odinarchaeia archaeon]
MSHKIGYPGRGLIQILILKITYEQPTHGYQIMKKIEEITSGNYIPETGTIYTMLRRLDKMGYLKSTWEKIENRADRRVYSITKKGKEALKNGIKLLKQRRNLIEELIAFYDSELSNREK